eukprot:3503825-Rhodomonas_salina.1
MRCPTRPYDAVLAECVVLGDARYDEYDAVLAECMVLGDAQYDGLAALCDAQDTAPRRAVLTGPMPRVAGPEGDREAQEGAGGGEARAEGGAPRTGGD